jgi:hypothetical protein
LDGDAGQLADLGPQIEELEVLVVPHGYALGCVPGEKACIVGIQDAAVGIGD